MNYIKIWFEVLQKILCSLAASLTARAPAIGLSITRIAWARTTSSVSLQAHVFVLWNETLGVLTGIAEARHTLTSAAKLACDLALGYWAIRDAWPVDIDFTKLAMAS